MSGQDDYYYDSYPAVSDEPLDPVQIVPLNSSFLVGCQGAELVTLLHNGEAAEWAGPTERPGPPPSYLVEGAGLAHSGTWACSSSQELHQYCQIIFLTQNSF